MNGSRILQPRHHASNAIRQHPHFSTQNLEKTRKKVQKSISGLKKNLKNHFLHAATWHFPAQSHGSARGGSARHPTELTTRGTAAPQGSRGGSQMEETEQSC